MLKLTQLLMHHETVRSLLRISCLYRLNFFFFFNTSSSLFSFSHCKAVSSFWKNIQSHGNCAHHIILLYLTEFKGSFVQKALFEMYCLKIRHKAC